MHRCNCDQVHSYVELVKAYHLHISLRKKRTSDTYTDVLHSLSQPVVVLAGVACVSSGYLQVL